MGAPNVTRSTRPSMAKRCGTGSSLPMHAPVARHAADVRAPVLILSGEKDPLFPAEHHQALVKAFPGAGARVYPGLGHNFLWEQPAEVAQAIVSFIGD